jgi:hypothetical protein
MNKHMIGQNRVRMHNQSPLMRVLSFLTPLTPLTLLTPLLLACLLQPDRRRWSYAIACCASQ